MGCLQYLQQVDGSLFQENLTWKHHQIFPLRLETERLGFFSLDSAHLMCLLDHLKR